MLAARAAANTRVGSGRENPADRSSAVAQTASRTPERTRTSQYTTDPQDTVLSLSGYGVLVREPGPGLSRVSHAASVLDGQAGVVLGELAGGGLGALDPP